MPLNHAQYMNRCLELASCGLGNVAPNPMVGSVIVCEGKIIGEGYHRKYGEAHAEVNAIRSVKNPELLKKSTLYVNLEPCSHYGKTPPCAELIVHSGIPEVVVGITDPNPAVSGNGIRMLQEAGCRITVDILPRECRELNKRFLTFQEKKRPYVILKWAETADHFLDKLRDPSEKPSWITNDQSKTLVHKWRSEEQAIMVGTNTALMDNPRLNVREWAGKNPLRIVIDRKLRLPSHLNLFDGSVPTIVYTTEEIPSQKPNIQYIPINFEKEAIREILAHLHSINIASVIVEGGSILLNSLIQTNLWDEARVFGGPMYFHRGIQAPKINIPPFENHSIENVTLKVFKNQSS